MNKKIIFRILAILAWAGFGYLAYCDPTHGLLTVVCAIVLMLLCYKLDKQFGDMKQVIDRLDYLEETIEGAQDNENLILQEMMITSDNITDPSDYNEGMKAGLDKGREIVKHRFDELFIKLSTEKSEL